MFLHLYAIKDELGEFMPPMAIETEAQAKREFRELTRTNQLMKNNPEDFSLWKVGLYNAELGKIEALENPELIERAKSYFKLEEVKHEQNI